ncbi:MAG TPA: RpiB/LacA/LacB family sugar-phosphate isomerase [Polyangiaceae bacterium]|jgi:ribose 5-phosphate isomerase B
MRIAFGADEKNHMVDAVVRHLEQSGHLVRLFGAAGGEPEAWGETGVRVARSVASNESELGIVCCWTGTGVSIAANKVPGIRAALCGDAETARGARKWNDANVLALSLRATSEAVAREIVDAWLNEPYGKTEEESLGAISRAERHG